MYFEGTITIDPSEITKITNIKPTKAFKKFLHSITLGAVSDKEERETFTAVAILQQINATFRQLKVNNIIKLSHDDIDFYHDTEGKENDLKLALDKYDIEINDAMSTNFKQLNMVLEHKDDTFKYLYEIKINKDHKVGVHPIEIKISALLNRFAKENAQDEIKKVLEYQEAYDLFQKQMHNEFEAYLNTIKFQLKKEIKIDNIDVFIKNQIYNPF